MWLESILSEVEQKPLDSRAFFCACSKSWIGYEGQPHFLETLPAIASNLDSVHNVMWVMEKGSSSKLAASVEESFFLTFSKNFAVLILYNDCMQVEDESQNLEK